MDFLADIKTKKGVEVKTWIRMTDILKICERKGICTKVK